MTFLFSLLGNRSTWIVLLIAALCGGAWFKIHSLQNKLTEATANIETLKLNNATLKQNLELSIAVNESNAGIVAALQEDQKAAATTLLTLHADLGLAKGSLEDAKKKLAAVSQVNLVPSNISETVKAIQKSRDDQLNKAQTAKDGK